MKSQKRTPQKYTKQFAMNTAKRQRKSTCDTT